MSYRSADARGVLTQSLLLMTSLCASLSLGGCAASPSDPVPLSDDPGLSALSAKLVAGDNLDGLGNAPMSGTARRALFKNLLSSVADRNLDLDLQLTPGETANGIASEQYSIASTPDRRSAGTLLKPEHSSGRLPVVIALHNTSGVSTLGFLKDFINNPAGQFIGVAPIGPYFAESGTASYVKAMVNAYEDPGQSYPFLYDTVWDVMRTIDYLVTREDVDPSRIGIVGFSKGGMEIFLAAAADPRIAVAAPIIGVCSFKWALDNNQWQARATALVGAPEGAAALDGSVVDAGFMREFYSRVSPGLVDVFDGPQMLPLIAPRPLRVMNGLTDPRNPIQGVQLAIDAAEDAYTELGAADKLSFVTANVGHDQTPFLPPAREWLLQWLTQPAQTP